MSSVSRRSFLAGSLVPLSQAQPARRPNIIFVCADQHSGRILGANGHPIVRTPNLDRLASMGVHFRNAYCGNPVCVPSRASMMTGMYASDVGSYCNSTPFDGRVPSWGNRLRDSGYYCRARGKLDLTKGVDFGFDERHTGHGHFENPDITSLFRAPVCFRPGERNEVDGQFKDRESEDAAMVDDGLAFLRSEAGKIGKPWALYLGLHLPHPRWIAQRKYLEIYPPDKMPLPSIPPGYLENRHPMFQVLANFKNISTPIPEDRVRRARAAYFGMVTELDEQIGRLVSELDRTRQWENTLFVYTSDHGEMLGEHGLWLKNVLLENAAQVPLILAGAGLQRSQSVDTPVSHVDLVATLLDVAGSPIPRELRGHSLLKMDAHPGFAFSESHSEGNCTGSFLIRKGGWTYIHFTGDKPLLFNLKDDPGELHNLAGKRESAAIERELHGRLTSLLDPDAVTERAFAEQEKRLNAMASRMGKDQFYEMLVGRLGPAQARALTNKQYRTA